MVDFDLSLLDRYDLRQLHQLLALAGAGPRLTWRRLVEVGDSDQLDRLLAEMPRDETDPPDSLVRVVCSPDAPLAVLRSIKGTAKRWAAAAVSPSQRAAATLLYHLSIAAALGRHSRNISSTDPAGCGTLYQTLAIELPDHALAAVFEKALATLPSPESGRP